MRSQLCKKLSANAKIDYVNKIRNCIFVNTKLIKKS